MLKYEYEFSRKIIVSYLKLSGYYDDWYEGNDINLPIPHYLVIYSNKINRNRLQGIMKKFIIDNMIEVANYLNLKMMLNTKYDNFDESNQIRFSNFLKCDIETICVYLSDFRFSIQSLFLKDKIERKKMIEMRLYGYTLEAVGQEYSITRERVRQIVDKYIVVIDFIFGRLFSFFFDKNIIFLKDLDIFDFDEELRRKFEGYLNESELFRKIKIFGFYIFKNSNEYGRIEQLTNSLLISQSISCEDIENYLLEIGLNVSQEMIGDCLILNKYSYFNNKYIKFLRYADYLVEIIKVKFPMGIEIKQLGKTSDFDKLIDYAKIYFPNLRFSEEPRAVQARLSENLVAIDRSIYISKDTLERRCINIDFIIDYLSSSDSRIYYFSELFTKFESDLEKIDVKNWYLLRELIKINYGDYAFFTRDYMEIECRKGAGYLKERIAEYIKKSSLPTTTKEISDAYKEFSTIMLYNALNQNHDIQKWGRDSWISSDKFSILPISNDIFIEVNSILSMETYISYDRLFYVLLKNINLKDSFILSHDNLHMFLLNIYPNDFEYFEEGLSVIGTNLNCSIEKRFVTLLNTHPNWNYHDLQLLFSYQRISNSLINLINSKLIKSSIRLDCNNYILSEYFEIDDKLVEQVENDIEYIIGNFENHISPHYLIDEGYLPYDVEFSWNWYVLTSVINNKSSKFKVLLPVPSDRRYQDGLIVGKECQLLISDIIAQYFISLGLKKASDLELKKFLNGRKISSNIPHEFYQNSKINFENGYFNFEVELNENEFFDS